MLNLLKSNCCSCSSAFNLNFRRYITTSQLKEYYAILNVNNSSTQKEIKDSFLKLSKIYHPDNKETGSHLKFVKLKEAYDAIKEGPPSVTGSSYTKTRPSSASTSSSYSSSSNQSSYSSRYNDPDINKRAHDFYRRRYRNTTTNEYNGFGGPFKNSSTPWEDFKKDQEYRRQQRYGYASSTRPLIHVTIFLSAIAWIVIYSGVLLIWDYNEQIKKGMFKFKPRSREEYLAYEEYLRRKESERLLRTKKDVGKVQNVPTKTTTTNELLIDTSDNKDATITTNSATSNLDNGEDSLDENNEIDFVPLASSH